jgi:hypothetical protein
VAETIRDERAITIEKSGEEVVEGLSDVRLTRDGRKIKKKFTLRLAF